VRVPEAIKRVGRPMRELALRLATARKGVRRVVNGIEYRVDSRCRHRFAPEYEAAGAGFLCKRIAPGAVVYNVGANVGVLTVQLARWSGPRGRVLAFEPNPYATCLLKRNLRLNGLDSQVEIVGVAIGDTVGDVTLHVSGANGMARVMRANPLLPKTEAVRVPVTTLDRFWDSRQVKPDWIVMDIEGWEVAALRGGRELLSATEVGVVLELHPDAWSWCGDSRADLERILLELRRRPIALSGQNDPLAEYGQVYLESRTGAP